MEKIGIIIGIIVGIAALIGVSISDILKPILKFTLVSQDAYEIKNNSPFKTAEDVLVSFGLFDIEKFDLNSTNNQPIPLVAISQRPINPRSKIGRTKLFPENLNANKYFGLIYLGAKHAKQKIYFVYVDDQNIEKSFYIQLSKDMIEESGIKINPVQIITQDTEYLDQLFPKKDRIYLKI